MREVAAASGDALQCAKVPPPGQSLDLWYEFAVQS